MNTIPVVPVVPLVPHSASEPCPGGCVDLKKIEEKMCQSRFDIDEINRRIAETHDEQTRLETRVDDSNERMERIELALSNTTAELSTNTRETSEILSILREAQAFFRFSRRAGGFLKWVFGLGTTALIFYYTLKDWVKH